MKRRIVVANWKMYPGTLTDARALFRAVVRRVARVRTSKVIICPPTLYLANLINNYSGTTISFGTQDASTELDTGSFTGEVSPKMLKRAGADYVIVGHSERRLPAGRQERRGETNELVAEKNLAALTAGLVPIVCVGEQARDEEGKYLRWLEREIRESLDGVSRQRAKKLMVAYEPIWAIGKTARDAASPRDVHQMSLFIRKVLVRIYGRKTAQAIKILYGGSVEPANSDALMEEGMVDGFLVGHASLDADMFADIVKRG